LRYELRRHHVALIGWIEGAELDAVATLEREGRALARMISEAEPLVVPAGRGLVWVWAGSFETIEPPDRALASELAPSVRFAVGEPGQGLDGFRRSHAQAERVRRLVTSASSVGSLARYRELALAATLCADKERARTFAREELGVLAGPDPALQRLRETLAVYLDAGASPLHAANRLGVHAKTVAYRMRRVEELLGRPIVQRRAELEAALLIAVTLGTD
jgi:DNA-binding PucR family transcriptional regulator